MKKVDLSKYGTAKDKELRIAIEERRSEMNNTRMALKQSDGSTVEVYLIESVQAFDKAVKEYHEWLQNESM